MAQSNAVAQIEKVAESYIAVWNEPNAEGRRQAVVALWTEDGTYTDPLAAVEGHENIEGVIAGVREQFPGHAFRLVGDADGCCTKVRPAFDALVLAVRFACKSIYFLGGAEGIRPPDLRRAKATRDSPAGFWALQNLCKSAYLLHNAFPELSGHWLGLLHTEHARRCREHVFFKSEFPASGLLGNRVSGTESSRKPLTSNVSLVLSRRWRTQSRTTLR